MEVLVTNTDEEALSAIVADTFPWALGWLGFVEDIRTHSPLMASYVNSFPVQGTFYRYGGTVYLNIGSSAEFNLLRAGALVLEWAAQRSAGIDRLLAMEFNEGVALVLFDQELVDMRGWSPGASGLAESARAFEKMWAELVGKD